MLGLLGKGGYLAGGGGSDPLRPVALAVGAGAGPLPWGLGGGGGETFVAVGGGACWGVASTPECWEGGVG